MMGNIEDTELDFIAFEDLDTGVDDDDDDVGLF